MLDEILNYLEINLTLGTAGQPAAGQFADIQKAGYEVVINLLPISSPKALPDEPAMVAQLGMQYISIPVIWDAPTASDLELFFEAMARHSGRKIFVHCAMNMRVSAFVFLYRVLVEGIPPQEAEMDMLMIWEPNPTWQQFIDQALASRR